LPPTVADPLSIAPPDSFFILPDTMPAVAAGKTRVLIFPTVCVPYNPELITFDGASWSWADPNGLEPGRGINIKWHLHPGDTDGSACDWSGFFLPEGVSAVSKIWLAIRAIYQPGASWLAAAGSIWWSLAFTDQGIPNDGRPHTFIQDVTNTYGSPASFDYASLHAHAGIDATLQSDPTHDTPGSIIVPGVALVVDATVETAGPDVLPYLKIPQGQGQTISELEGHSTISRLAFDTIDVRGEIKALAAEERVVGTKVLFKLGFPEMALTDFVTLHTDQLVNLGSDEDGWMNFEADDVQRWLLDLAWRKGGPDDYVPYQEAPDPPLRDALRANSVDTFDKNPRYLAANPLQILIVALQNELGIGQASADPSTWLIYDPEQDASAYDPALGLPPSNPTLIYPNPYVDLDRVAQLAHRDFSGDRMEFKITRPVTGKQWIDDQILKPLGLFWIVRPSGALALKTMKSPETTGTAAWTQDTMLGIPRAERLAPINVVTFRFNADEDQRETAARQYQNEVTFKYQASIDRYHGQEFKHQVEANGLRPAYGGMLRAQILANRVFRRRGIGTPQYTIQTLFTQGRLEVGEFVRISHPLVLDYETGLKGISGVLCEIIDKQPDYASGAFTWKLLDGRFLGLSTPYYILKRGSFNAPGSLIAPTSVPEWTSASAAQKEKYMFAADATTGEYSDSTPGHVIVGGSVISQGASYLESIPEQQSRYMFISAVATGNYTNGDAGHTIF
jgi:hypothetical protein